MATKDEPLFYLEDGTPVYATDGPTPAAAPRRFGDTAPKTQSSSHAAPTPALMPFAPETKAASGGSAKMLVDYTKSPGETTVPGQPGYNASKDPFREKTSQEKAAQSKKDASAKKQTELLSRHPAGEWWQKTRGEKTGGSGLNAIHVDAWEARRLQLELESQRRLDEVLYPGSRGRQHSAGGTNLGSPSWSGSGGGAFRQGVDEWVMASGAVVGQHGVTLVEVLDSWNIYDGQ